MSSPDKSNGYEEIAPIFISERGRNSKGIGVSVVAEWSQALPNRGTVLDLGCGTGVPISEVLIERGFDLFAVDASPRMVTAFRGRFPNVPVECAAVEDSDFFGRTFDGVVAWGLIFLLEAETQRKLLAKVAAILPRGGKLLFTSPKQSCSWADAMTGQISVSLGYEGYQRILAGASMSLLGTRSDEGENYYYLAQKIW